MPSPSVGHDLVPQDEAARLAAVRRYDILDTPPDGAFDRITSLAARMFDVPISIVSVVDTDRIWFKSHHGLDVEQIGRDPGLCASAIMHEGPWVVENAPADPRTLANPLVAGEFGLRFYAGVPLTTSDGYNLGTLCVIDCEPRSVTEAELHDLADLAAIVMDEMELRVAARRVVHLEQELRTKAEHVARVLQESLLPKELPASEDIDLAVHYRPASNERVSGDFYDVFPAPDGWGLVVGDVCGHGPEAAALTSMVRHTLHTLVGAGWSPGRALAQLNEALADRPIAERRYCTVALAHLRPSSAGAALTLALGGHPAPVCVRASGRTETVGRPSPIVGWRSEVNYPECAVELGPRDALVMYTDGLTDARSGPTYLDESTILEVLGRTAGGSAEDIADGLMAAVDDVGQALRDDVAVLVARLRH